MPVVQSPGFSELTVKETGRNITVGEGLDPPLFRFGICSGMNAGRGHAPAVTLWFLSGNDISKNKTTPRRGDHWSPAAVGHPTFIMAFTCPVDEGFRATNGRPYGVVVTFHHSPGRHPSDPPEAGHLPSRGGFRVVPWYHSTDLARTPPGLASLGHPPHK